MLRARQELSLLTNVLAIKCPPPRLFMLLYHLKIDCNSRRPLERKV